MLLIECHYTSSQKMVFAFLLIAKWRLVLSMHFIFEVFWQLSTSELILMLTEFYS